MNKKLRNYDTKNNNKSLENLSGAGLPDKKIIKENFQAEMKKTLGGNLTPNEKIKSIWYHLHLDSDPKSTIIDYASCTCDLTSLTFCLSVDKVGLITRENMEHNTWKAPSKMLGT